MGKEGSKMVKNRSKQVKNSQKTKQTKEVKLYIVLELDQNLWIYGKEDIAGNLYAFKTEKEAMKFTDNNPGCIYLGIPIILTFPK